MDYLIKNMNDLKNGIKACLIQRAPLPSLILLYSAIDIIAWLCNDNPSEKVGVRFMNWVDNYLLKAKPLPCTSADLYGARCGIVHTLTPESDMSSKGRARQIGYTWGNENVDVLQRVTEQRGLSERLCWLKIEDLFEAWQSGLDILIEEMNRDEALKERVLTRAAQFFESYSTSHLRGLGDVIELE